jgi:aryl-alcohol dehydrogenase-like predicted oxidoreductase
MEYRTLGNTGLKVSYLSYGASSLGSVFREVNESEGIRTVHTALDLGINYIDVSPYYGATRAETVLGKALREISRDRFYLATKAGRYGDVAFDFSAQRVTASIDESLDRLNVDYLDVIQCHDIEFADLDQIVSETIPALMRAREVGKVRYVGVTGLPLKIFEYVLARVEIDLILSYCHYSLNDRSLASLLPFLQEKGVGIVSASPLSMGLLTERGAPPWHPATDQIKKICRSAADHCRARGSRIEKLGMQYALSNENIHTTLVGTADPENIKRNVCWIEEPIDQGLLNEVSALLEPIQDLTWVTGRRENTGDFLGREIRLAPSLP